MNIISKNIQQIKSEHASSSFTLVAVSKTKPHSAIEAAYEGGHRHFGENKVQELVEKYHALPKDICWHMIGHLQRNKVKYIAEFVHLVHGVDTEKLLIQINKEGKKVDRKIPCLLQVHIAQEESKFGFSPTEVTDLLNGDTLDLLEHVQVKGLMGMATNTPDSSVVSQEFRILAQLYDNLKEEFNFDTLSMGMSSDYPLALETGSNMIRVGSAIFGQRDYAKK